MKDLIPPKTVERLSVFRRLLIDRLNNGETFIYSHELAAIANSTAAQVRRDIMSIGYTGNPRRGYDIEELISFIGKTIDSKVTTRAALVGAGNLGKAILNYFKGKRPKLEIAAAFDINPAMLSHTVADIQCFHIDDLEQKINELNITVAIITAPGSVSQKITDSLIKSGVKGIVNFSPIPVKVPENVYLEELDITVSLEKVSYFAKHQK